MKRIFTTLCGVFAAALQAQTVNLHGTVSNGSGKAIANAAVTLVGQSLKDTTDSKGAYLLSNTTSIRSGLGAGRSVALVDGRLRIALAQAAPVRVDVFDVKGNRIRGESMPMAAAGTYRMDVAGSSPTSGVLFVKVAVGDRATTLRCFPLGSGRYAASAGSAASTGSGRALAASVVSVYGNTGFDGLEATLGVGTYTTAQLVAAGAKDNDISSMRIPAGVSVELFDGDNFQTSLGVFTSDQSDFPSLGINDKVSSMIVSSIAYVDSLRVVAKGYIAKSVPLLSLDSLVNVSLDTLDTSSGGIPLKNAAVPSAGCGSAAGLSSGKLTMTSAGLNREYDLSLPSSYNSSHPYRLIFGMHWMNGSDDAVQTDGWYRMKPLDTDNSTIWVAPQGYTDGSPWRGSDDKDHVFFEDMVKLFKSKLCVDTTRIFSVGFSFGSMFTNALAQTHQGTLRGVLTYETADYNIYFPTNTGRPLAYFGVSGTADNLTPPDAGERSAERFAKNNGCPIPATVAKATTSTHVCQVYQCPNNLPVNWCTHNGGHTDQPMDPGQTTSWVVGESWKFITQF
jgi:poly(3-hydroxybutyrate) depolymerase